MADMVETLKGILGDDAEEKIQSVLSGLQSSGSAGEEESTGDSSVPALSKSLNGADYLSQIKSLVGQMGNANDSRSNLLLSLKPYMREERKHSIDNAVKILNLTRIAGLFK